MPRIWEKPKRIMRKAEKERREEAKGKEKEAEEKRKRKLEEWAKEYRDEGCGKWEAMERALKREEEEKKKEVKEERKKKLEEWAKKYRDEGLDQPAAWEKALERKNLERRKSGLEKIAKLSPRELLAKKRQTYLNMAEYYEKEGRRIGFWEPDTKLIETANEMRRSAERSTAEAQLKEARMVDPDIEIWEDTDAAEDLKRGIESARRELEKLENKLREDF
jgi:phenylalanyl-tRNA synthetase alpha subunit